MKTVLITGGAGYVGSHCAKAFAAAGWKTVVLDNLSRGWRDAVRWGPLVEADIADEVAVRTALEQYRPDVVAHFAAYAYVGESVSDPALYYRNNTAGTLGLLEAMRAAGSPALLFSSTCASYGVPEYVPIDEAHPQRPINAYGASKQMVERALQDYDRAYGLHSVCLRYFNAAGAHPSAEIGEQHDPETHLIPLLLQVASGKRETAHIFGRDYDTPDGTCIRDYVHVVDLCHAHVAALRFLDDQARSGAFNLGNGSGFSVLEVVAAAEKVTGRKLNLIDSPRRHGDPARLVADASLARRVLEWSPQYADIETIVQHAWRWETKAVRTPSA